MDERRHLIPRHLIPRRLTSILPQCPDSLMVKEREIYAVKLGVVSTPVHSFSVLNTAPFGHVVTPFFDTIYYTDASTWSDTVAMSERGYVHSGERDTREKGR
ncbi:hypothetical protein AG1IA_00744 [Rhizoctonia solani AG-1 IA]|uniref:Uncharacterized protein n=1 Tax=Thanatephorus cucumeris (strain AG1-IA) TaxID=983506 RepID=L8X817_THACA|nr:hypothetical protein AG1IA_00744 [Rhizoctonia solani AG-1 IA]